MDDQIPDDEPCVQCGICCRIFGPNITPTVPNVYLWMEQERTDILRWFVAYREKNTPINCADLKIEDLGNTVTIEMRNPETGDYVTVCPFLRRVTKERYLCGIHLVKPDMCCTYQPWIWGETYFNKCRGLLKMNGDCKWQL
jgi:Fe-S-cluster containining protein